MVKHTCWAEIDEQCQSFYSGLNGCAAIGRGFVIGVLHQLEKGKTLNNNKTEVRRICRRTQRPVGAAAYSPGREKDVVLERSTIGWHRHRFGVSDP